VLELGAKPDASALRLSQCQADPRMTTASPAAVRSRAHQCRANTPGRPTSIDELDSPVRAGGAGKPSPSGRVIRSAKPSRLHRRPTSTIFRGAQRSLPVETRDRSAVPMRIEPPRSLDSPDRRVIHGFCLGWRPRSLASPVMPRIAIDGARVGFPKWSSPASRPRRACAFDSLVIPMQAMTLIWPAKTIEMRSGQSRWASSMPWRRSGMFAIPSGRGYSAA